MSRPQYMKVTSGPNTGLAFSLAFPQSRAWSEVGKLLVAIFMLQYT